MRAARRGEGGRSLLLQERQGQRSHHVCCLAWVRVASEVAHRHSVRLWAPGLPDLPIDLAAPLPQNGILLSGCSEVQRAGYEWVQSLVTALEAGVGTDDQASCQYSETEHLVDHWRKRQRLAGGGCWSALPVHGGCGWFD